ncbi:MAG: hypothetical protein L0287_32495, partial [Anaerolineae bacterium]|nr:hypothetical protein [Anaerolineae bacterium]
GSWDKKIEVSAFALAINASGHIFAGTHGGGVFRSINNGNNWTPVNIGLTNITVVALAINPATQDIFAGTDGGGVFRSTDNGNSWTQVNNGLTNTAVTALAINPATGDIFAGGVFRSTNNGNSWTAVNNGLTNTDVIALAINASGDIFAGTNGCGVFRSTNNGDSWAAVNTGLIASFVYALAINPATRDIFAGTDGGGVFLSTDNGNSWTEVNNGLTSTRVVELAINRFNGNILAGTFGGGVFRSTDNGASWTSANNGLTNAHVFALAINSSGPIFAGTDSGGVFLSTNNADTWTAIKTGATNTDVHALAINSSGHIFAGTGRYGCSGCGLGVFRSTNNGVSWTQINTGLTDLDVFALAINDNGHIFAGTYGGGVFWSTDNGNNWIAVNTGLTNTRVFPLTINANGHIFAGTDGGGVFRSTNNGNNWDPVNSGLTIPTVTTVFAFAINASGYIFAGTNHGVFRSVASTLPTYPSTLSISTTVNYPSLPNASSYKETDYRIVGLPGKSDLPVNQFLSGTQNKDWQVYWDNGAASDFFVAFDGSSTFQFSAGRAFWIINKGPVNINTTVPSAPLNAAQEVVIPLQSGWNLITNPFTSAIAWSKIQTADTLSEPIYAFNGSFAESSTFDPYVGYYFFNATNRSSLKIPYSLLFSTVTATNVDPTIWRVNISLSSGEFSDKSTSFGIAPEASPDLDRLDFRKPRAIATTPTVEFKRPEWDASYSTFATDIRPEFEESESWAFDVRAIPHQPAQLTFSGIRRIPAHFEVYLIDEGRAQSANLREDSLYHFTPAAELMKFKVVVGRKENVQEQLSSLALPKEFALGPNYPNPFLSTAQSRSAGNPTTTIPVAIPKTSEAKLKIYNLLGEEVKTIYDGTIEAGRYWFNWDGRNELGNNVVTGVYLYRLNTSTGVSLLGKMILLR